MKKTLVGQFYKLKSNRFLKFQAHPGTKIVIPNNYSNWASLEPMWAQVLKFGELVMQMSEEYPDGINLIGKFHWRRLI